MLILSDIYNHFGVDKSDYVRHIYKLADTLRKPHKN